MRERPGASHSLLEVLDVLWCFDPDSGARLPVSRSDALARLGNEGLATRLVAALPASDDVIDPAAIDDVSLAVHHELARLSQTLFVPERVAAGLRPLIDTVRSRTGSGTVRVVDVGCGIGLMMRQFAAHRTLGEGIELVGLDFNPVLVERAQRLAADESLDVSFLQGDAFTSTVAITDPARTVVVSQGLLHHLDDTGLRTFLAHHRQIGVAAFAHFDVNPGLWPRVGGWVLHRVRMREGISRHDGNLSLRRAYSADALLTAARESLANAYPVICADASGWWPAPPRALRPLTGVRR